MDFGKQVLKTPSPGSYQIKSVFEKRENEGITMGQGRDDIKCRDLFAMNKMKSPNPTSYKPDVYYNTRSYTMAKRLEYDAEKWIKQVPGPGNYEKLDLTNNKNEKRISKYLSAPASKFSLDQRKGLANKTLVPGPGQCKHYQIIFR